jgi:hypothetical protein
LISDLCPRFMGSERWPNNVNIGPNKVRSRKKCKRIEK